MESKLCTADVYYRHGEAAGTHITASYQAILKSRKRKAENEKYFRLQEKKTLRKSSTMQ